MKIQKQLLFIIILLYIGLAGLQAQTVKDIDGNEYNTIIIGTQEWMTENLKTTKYNHGADIPLVKDGSTWNDLSTPGYCWYNNDVASIKKTDGALYNWYAVNTDELCPTGWHVSSDAEWKVLTDYLGGEGIAGGKLRVSGKTLWSNNNANVTNESNFSALPSGLRDMKSGSYAFMGSAAFFWSSTEDSSTHAWGHFMQSPPEKVYRFPFNKAYGYCVRCVKD